MKELLFLLIGIVVIGWSFYAFLQRPAPMHYQWAISDTRVLKIGSAVIQIDIADTEEERALGLSGRESLEEESGLLFIFDEPGLHGFWMKDMNFPIDIVWISDEWRVVGVEREVGSETFPKVFYPPSAIRYVLELPAGNASTLGIDTGNEVYFDTQN